MPASEYKKTVLDTSYIGWIKSTYKNDKKQATFHLQPLQALYFNKDGSLVSFHVNCNAPGFPNLQWNNNGYFDVFVPKTQTFCDSLFEFEKLQNYFQNKVNHDESKNFKIVVFWNFFLEKQSRGLINQVLDNLKDVDKKEYDLVFVNNDLLYLKQ